jgi:metal-dependent HD superfamily phosphatase/phosphodiesterase
MVTKKSPKAAALERVIRKRLSGVPLAAVEAVFSDPEVRVMHDYANVVSIKRLGFNDHGPVHMRKAALNAIIMFDLLSEAGIPMNLEKEGIGTREDSLVAVILASLLHDLGMTVAREKHELLSVVFAMPIVERILLQLYPDQPEHRIILRSTVIEGIVGHMATQKIHSLEAGLVLVGDGCDMEHGRARIPSMLNITPRVGDIHRYSSNSVQKVNIIPGEEKPIRIAVEMSEAVGFFQIEEVLFPKIASSPVKPYIELLAGVSGQEALRYL